MEEGVEFGFVPQQLPFAGNRMYSQGLVVGIAQCLCNNLEFALGVHISCTENGQSENDGFVFHIPKYKVS